MEESDDESNKDKVGTATGPESDNCKLEGNQENLALMAGVGSYDKYNALLDTKVCFQQAKVNIYTYYKKNLKSLSHVLIEAYLTIYDSKEPILEDTLS